jgi:hypothetical protein
MQQEPQLCGVKCALMTTAYLEEYTFKNMYFCVINISQDGSLLSQHVKIQNWIELNNYFSIIIIITITTTNWMTGWWELYPRHTQKGFSSSLCLQTYSGAHPASCRLGTGVPIPGG